MQLTHFTGNAVVLPATNVTPYVVTGQAATDSKITGQEQATTVRNK